MCCVSTPAIDSVPSSLTSRPTWPDRKGSPGVGTGALPTEAVPDLLRHEIAGVAAGEPRFAAGGNETAVHLGAQRVDLHVQLHARVLGRIVGGSIHFERPVRTLGLERGLHPEAGAAGVGAEATSASSGDSCDAGVAGCEGAAGAAALPLSALCGALRTAKTVAPRKSDSDECEEEGGRQPLPRTSAGPGGGLAPGGVLDNAAQRRAPHDLHGRLAPGPELAEAAGSLAHEDLEPVDHRARARRPSAGTALARHRRPGPPPWRPPPAATRPACPPARGRPRWRSPAVRRARDPRRRRRRTPARGPDRAPASGSRP